MDYLESILLQVSNSDMKFNWSDFVCDQHSYCGGLKREREEEQQQEKKKEGGKWCFLATDSRCQNKRTPDSW